MRFINLLFYVTLYLLLTVTYLLGDNKKLVKVDEIVLKGGVYCNKDTIYNLDEDDNLFKVELNKYGKPFLQRIYMSEHDLKKFNFTERKSDMWIYDYDEVWEGHLPKTVSSPEGMAFRDTIKFENNLKVIISYFEDTPPGGLIVNDYKLELYEGNNLIDKVIAECGTALARKNQRYNKKFFYIIGLSAGAHDYSIVLEFYEVRISK